MLLHMYTDCRLSWLCARYKGAAWYVHYSETGKRSSQAALAAARELTDEVVSPRPAAERLVSLPGGTS